MDSRDFFQEEIIILAQKKSRKLDNQNLPTRKRNHRKVLSGQLAIRLFSLFDLIFFCFSFAKLKWNVQLASVKRLKLTQSFEISKESSISKPSLQANRSKGCRSSTEVGIWWSQDISLSLFKFQANGSATSGIRPLIRDNFKFQILFAIKLS